MTLARYTGTVQDAAGNAVAGCEIEVRSESTGLLARLYSDRDGLVGMSNRFTAPEATFSFHTAGGAYRVTATKAGFSAEWRFVAIGTMQEVDVEGIVFALQAGIVPALTRAELELYIPPVPEEGEALPRAGVVYADPVASNNGYWVYSFDDTEWQFARPLSDTLARLTIVGGDENAIVATASPGINPASVIAFFIEPDEPNTGNVTISVDGADPVSAYDYTGNEFPAGAFSGRLFLTREADGSLRSVMPADLVAQAQYWAELSEQVTLPDGSIAEVKLDTALAAKVNNKLNADASNVGDATAQEAFRAAIGADTIEAEAVRGDTDQTGKADPWREQIWANTRQGCVKISSGVLSDVATLDIILPDGYNSYQIRLSMVPTTDITDIWMRASNDGGATFLSGASDYKFTNLIATASVSVQQNNGASVLEGIGVDLIGNGADEGVDGIIEIIHPQDAPAKARLMWSYAITRSDTSAVATRGNGMIVPSFFDAIRIMFNSGNIASGTYEVYGYV